MAKAPAFQFFVRDWTTDCNGLSVAAKGAWIQMICQLHLAPKRGELTKTAVAWARICGCSSRELTTILAELSSEKVCDMSQNVTDGHAAITIVSRRIAAERKAKEDAKIRQQKHRGQQNGHKNVTSPSASAVSASASATAKQTTPLPPSLDNSEFQKAWKRWIAYRLEKRKKLTKSTIKAQLAKLAKTPGDAVAKIERSIEQGWIGLFPLDKKPSQFAPADTPVDYSKVGTQH